MRLHPRATTFLVVTSLVAGAAAGPPSSASPPAILPLSDIREGMVGTVTTVLHGTTRETIEIELLGVLDDGIGPGLDMILCRLRGDLGVWTGVAAGMSGSPVTVDGRLVGALSYSIGGFSKEPLCGITPIEAMLALEQYPARLEPWQGAAVAARASGLEPVPLALSTRGINATQLAADSELLRALGVAQPLQAVPASAGGPEGDLPPLEPGDAVSGLLIWGDFQVAATGTVTWRDGERLLAFGHPFLASGRSAIPIAPARIVWTVPSMLSSFKIATIGAPCGTMTQDRISAVEATIGTLPAGLPLSITVVRAGESPVRRSLFVARDPVISPALADLAVRTTLAQELGRERHEVLSARGTITLAGGRRLPFSATGPGTIAGDEQAIGGELARRLTALMRPPLPIPAVESVAIEVSSADPEGAYTVKRVLPDRLICRPGETLRVTLELEGPRGEERRESLTLTLPPDVLPGRYGVFAGSPRTLAGELGSVAEARRRTARSTEDYLAALERDETEAALGVVLALPAQGMVASGREYPALPGTAQILMRDRAAAGDAARARWLEVARASMPFERSVAAVARTTIEILGEGPSR